MSKSEPKESSKVLVDFAKNLLEISSFLAAQQQKFFKCIETLKSLENLENILSADSLNEFELLVDSTFDHCKVKLRVFKDLIAKLRESNKIKSSVIEKEVCNEIIFNCLNSNFLLQDLNEPNQSSILLNVINEVLVKNRLDSLLLLAECLRVHEDAQSSRKALEKRIFACESYIENKNLITKEDIANAKQTLDLDEINNDNSQNFTESELLTEASKDNASEQIVESTSMTDNSNITKEIPFTSNKLIDLNDILLKHGFKDFYIEVNNSDLNKYIKNKKSNSCSRKLRRAMNSIHHLLIEVKLEKNGEFDLENDFKSDDEDISLSENIAESNNKEENNKTENLCDKSQINTRSKTSMIDQIDKSLTKSNEIKQKENYDSDFDSDGTNEDEETLNRPLTRSRFKDESDLLIKKRVAIMTSEEDSETEKTVEYNTDEENELSDDDDSEDSNDSLISLLKQKKSRRSPRSISSMSGVEVSLNESDLDDENDNKTLNEPNKKDLSNSEKINRNGNTNRRKRRFAAICSNKNQKKRKEKKHKRQRIAIDSDDDLSLMSSENEDDFNRLDENKKSFRGRKIIPKNQLAKSTLEAEKIEKERRERLQEKQKEFNGIEMVLDSESDQFFFQLADQSVMASKLKSLTLDKDDKSEPPVPVIVHQSLINFLKPHQAEGIVFMYNSIFESLDRLDDESNHGGILAHCMGLGKTFQVIAFLHTILTHPKISKVVNRVMIIGPKNVTSTWSKEFTKWLANVDPELNSIEVFDLSLYSKMLQRIQIIKEWYNLKKPSVLIISYEIFRILTKSEEDEPLKKMRSGVKTLKKTKKIKFFQKLQIEFRQYLQSPGPQIIICDEGHKLKSDETSLFKTMNKIQTRRRLCLTGTPMQNNLKEYYTMVNFVKPGLLGTKNEFDNRFSNIISRGQSKEANALEVRCMKRRCHVLYEHLRAVVQRRDYNVLIQTIPPKQEYVIYVRMTDRQCQLYRAYLAIVFQRDKTKLNPQVLSDYYIFSRIWTHPYLLILHEKEVEKKRLFQDDINFCVSDDSSVSHSSGTNDLSNIPSTSSFKKEGSHTQKSPSDANEESFAWFNALVSNDDEHNFELGNKLVLLMKIIKKCEEVGDKLLIFSQSLESLRIIRKMLEYLSKNNLWFVDGHEALRADNEEWKWENGIDFLVIDGSVSNRNRDFIQEKFNNVLNLRARLMLISTLAGSLGINLVTANRVVIFDACWNPSHDTQAMFRVYRYGQLKPVYIYRLIAQGTMEERIYKRQVTKESMARRVTEEAQIQRHFSYSEIYQMYEFTPDIGNVNSQSQTRLAPPKDRLLADVILSDGNSIVSYIQHDSLFDEVVEEKLTDEERKEAWVDYEKEKSSFTFSQRVQSILPLKLIILPNESPVLQSITKNFSDDPLYKTCFTFSNMTHDIAIRILFVKRLLDHLLPLIPNDQRGELKDFEDYIVNIMNKFFNENKPPITVLERVYCSFRTTVAFVQNIPASEPVVRKLHSLAPQLFL